MSLSSLFSATRSMRFSNSVLLLWTIAIGVTLPPIVESASPSSSSSSIDPLLSRGRSSTTPLGGSEEVKVTGIVSADLPAGENKAILERASCIPSFFSTQFGRERFVRCGWLQGSDLSKFRCVNTDTNQRCPPIELLLDFSDGRKFKGYDLKPFLKAFRESPKQFFPANMVVKEFNIAENERSPAGCLFVRENIEDSLPSPLIQSKHEEVSLLWSLLQCPIFENNLTELDLSDNPSLGKHLDRDCDYLWAFKHACESVSGKLEKLNLGYVGMTGLLLWSLEVDSILSGMIELEELDLSSNPLESDGAEVLKDALPLMKKLKVLNLSTIAEKINRSDMENLGQGLAPLKKLEVLKFHSNEFEDEAIVHLASALQSLGAEQGGKLKILDLSCNSLSISKMRSLVEGLKHLVGLEELDLGTNDNLGDDGIQLFAEQALPFMTSLKKLYLNGTNISRTGMKYLAEGLKDNLVRLEELNLAQNKLGDEGAMIFLANALHSMKSLKKLSLSNNDITQEGRMLLLVMRMNNKYVDEERIDAG